jgi:hypothetical protein
MQRRTLVASEWISVSYRRSDQLSMGDRIDLRLPLDEWTGRDRAEL